MGCWDLNVLQEVLNTSLCQGDMSPSPQARRHGLLDIIHDVIMSDRRETIRYNANELGHLQGTVLDMAIYNALQMPKVLDCWVPKLF